MTENERIKEIRQHFKMTGEEFGTRLGITRGALSNIENGNRSVTPQIRKAICREFGVDYIWLTQGHGEMFFDDDDEDDGFGLMVDEILADEPESVRNAFKMFKKKYTREDWKMLFRLIARSATYLQELQEEAEKEVSESDTEEED
ncbi:MAG: helix-turn-helix transcriptional regulator [Lachnospiraceae bacterium]|nr:helix-turn-helix transcriptional regulator [Lachnospiraceae bacterium]